MRLKYALSRWRPPQQRQTPYTNECSLLAVGALSSVLTEQIPPHPYLLPIVLADYFQVVSESAASYAISCDSRDSTDHR